MAEGESSRTEGNNRDTPGVIFMGILTGASTLWGTIDDFGWAAALWISGGVTFLITMFLVLVRHLPGPWNAIARFFRTDAWPLWFLGLTSSVLILIGTWGYLYDRMGARLFRREFTKDHTHLGLRVSDYASDQFTELKVADTGSQEANERYQLQAWIRWMIEGAEKEPTKVDSSDVEQQGSRDAWRLIYLESVVFPHNYDDINASVQLTASIKVLDAVAFLLNENGDDIWYKPSWKELDTQIGNGDGGFSVIIRKPNNGQRLAVFARISAREGAKLPAKDNLVAKNIISIKK